MLKNFIIDENLSNSDNGSYKRSKKKIILSGNMPL